jgi:ABC-type sulfate transport system permease component
MDMKKEHKDEPAQQQLEEMPGTLPHFSLAILLLYGMNTGLSKLTHALGIQFPSALIGNHLSSHCVTGPSPCRYKALRCTPMQPGRIMHMS